MELDLTIDVNSSNLKEVGGYNMQGIQGYNPLTKEYTAHIILYGEQVASIKGSKKEIEDFKERHAFVVWNRDYDFRN